MTSATEELRRMLDERGVEWRDLGCSETEWHSSSGHLLRALQRSDKETFFVRAYAVTPAQAVEATLGPKVTGDTSDGYHTFNELYHHRAVLFSVIVRDHPDIAWKAKKHHDGTMYDGMFIVGVDTPQGQATYHYDIDPYWEMFDCRELDRAPEWDGHTPDDAIARIATLGRGEYSVSVIDTGNEAAYEHYEYIMHCDGCNHEYGYVQYNEDGDTWMDEPPSFCPNCGAHAKEVR